MAWQFYFCFEFGAVLWISYKMLKNNASSFNKKALLAEKEMILQELQYYEKRIQDFPNNSSSDYFNVNNRLVHNPKIALLKHL